MDAIDRVRIDGKTVVRTERTIDKGEPFYQLHYPFSETDFPGGPRTVCLALTLRMQQLAHAGARRRARRTHRGGRRQGDHRPPGRIHRDPRTAGPVH